MTRKTSKLDRDEALVELVVEQYLAGATLHNLACQHRVSWNCLRRTLVDRGVTIRPVRPPVRSRTAQPWQPSSGRRTRTLDPDQIEKLRANIGYRAS